jgi:hypothetical protein
VADNLNTHVVSSFYETFPPAEALRLSKRMEIRNASKHSGWLDIAEIELPPPAAQRLGNRRILGIEALDKEPHAWETQRNASQKSVGWGVTLMMPVLNLNGSACHFVSS